MLQSTANQFVVSKLPQKYGVNFTWVHPLNPMSGERGRYDLAEDANISVAVDILETPSDYCGEMGATSNHPTNQALIIHAPKRQW